MHRAWFWLVALSACQEASGPKQGAQVVMIDAKTDAAFSARAQGFELEFAAAQFVRLPSALRIGGSDAMDVLGSDTCPLENRLGIAMYPMFTVSSLLPTDTNVKSDVNIDWKGPGVVKVTVTYEVPYQCASKNTLKGTSVFTLFPYGRINRIDTVTPSSGPISNQENCGQCGDLQSPMPLPMNSKFFFTSYYTFGRTAGFFQKDGSSPIPAGAAPLQGCAEIGPRRVAVSWRAAPNFTQDYRVTPTGAYTYDWTRGTTDLAAAEQTEVSNIVVEQLVDPSDLTCAQMIDGYAVDPGLSINGEPAEVRPDGTYLRSSPVTSPITLTPVDAPIFHGLAIELPLAIDSLHHVHVHRDDGVDSGYVLQKLADDRLLIWIDDALESGQKTHIEYD